MTQFSLGLTGGIGSGKTTVANYFAQLGAGIIDTDAIAHALTAPNGLAITAIRASFGNDFISESGAMDRQKMRDQVFSSASQKQLLESILHPLIRQECEAAASALREHHPYLIFVIPLLVESGFWVESLDQILVVDCEQATQIQRVMARNGLPQEQVSRIIASQVPRSERLAVADDVINSDRDLSQVRLEVEKLHEKYINLALFR
ncbi:MAG: dephospho-CoA kinase [Undibacterium sp.]|nr:dephospho-CoA kinase [Undibacterium sp.]